MTTTSETLAPSTQVSSQAPPPPPPLERCPPLLIKKLSPTARTPTRGSAFAAGYDLYSAKPCTIPARGKALVDTDLAIAVSEGCCMRCFLIIIHYLLQPQEVPPQRPPQNQKEKCIIANLKLPMI